MIIPVINDEVVNNNGYLLIGFVSLKIFHPSSMVIKRRTDSHVDAGTKNSEHDDLGHDNPEIDRATDRYMGSDINVSEHDDLGHDKPEIDTETDRFTGIDKNASEHDDPIGSINSELESTIDRDSDSAVDLNISEYDETIRNIEMHQQMQESSQTISTNDELSVMTTSIQSAQGGRSEEKENTLEFSPKSSTNDDKSKLKEVIVLKSGNYDRSERKSYFDRRIVSIYLHALDYTRINYLYIQRCV